MRPFQPGDLIDSHIDLNRFGGLGWVQRTDGRLTVLDRGRLLAAALGTGVTTAVHLLGHRFARSRTTSGMDAGTLAPPDSRLAREAEQACAELPNTILEHSYRTWMLGLALATLDRCDLDRELFYCAALLHDFGLAKPTSGRDFTLAGATRAAGLSERAGLAPAKGQAISDGICVHPGAGINVRRDGAIGFYLQWGSMADIAGLRRSEVSEATLRQILSLHPRDDHFRQDMVSMVGAEARATPAGRFAFYRHLGMTLAIRFAPDWN